jgi:hypothetical protein
MAEGNGGVPPFDPWLNEQPPGAAPDQAPLVVSITHGEGADSDIEGADDGIELEDGSLLLDLSGRKPKIKDAAGAKAHGANLAEYIDEPELARIAEELHQGIEADLETRRDWLERRASGIKHLALKVENPRSPSADADTAVEGQTTVRSPVLLDAVLRFQANARGELLPAGGPVKMRNDTTLPSQTRKMQMQAAQLPPDESDMLAEALEKDFNHYLTVVDKAYYPDTNRMFFMQGYGGSGFKKVYRCPIKRRPMSRAIDASDVIVSDNEVSLEDCGRVTHRITMRPSVLKRMQLSGAYRDIDVPPPIAPSPDPAERAEDDVAGLAPLNARPSDYPHTIYESYCELDIEGFEHEEDGEVTGLPLPYRVTMDKDSREILEVRRNWREGDDRYLGRMPLVKYSFVEGIGFYGIGLLNIMGNATAAITTAWRLALDSGGFSSWPGFLYSEVVGRQDTMAFRVGLGSGARINTGGQPISQHIMPLPYKDATAGLVQITSHIEDEARRVGGTPELMTGEGRQDVPVGTTLAMLDQAVKVIDSVHKGMHISQAEELSLLRDLFIEDPDALLCSNPSPARQWERDELVRALRNCNLSPQADPNTPSHTIRVMKAVALVQLVMMNPQIWDMYAVVRRVSSMVGLGDVEDLFGPPQQGQAPDPKAMAAFGQLQLKVQELQLKAQDSEAKNALSHVDSMLKVHGEQMKLQNSREERLSRERVENAKLESERMQLAEGALVHPDATNYAQQFVRSWPTGRVI